MAAQPAWITDEQVHQALQVRGATSYSDGDPQVSAVVAAINQQLPLYLRRDIEQVERTEQFSPRRFGRMLSLPAYPVVIGDDEAPPVFVMVESGRRNFDSPDRTWLSSEFHVNRETGQVFLDYQFVGGAGTVQVQWTGGLATDPADLLASHPDIHQGGVLWAVETLRRMESMTTRAKGSKGTRQEFSTLDGPPPPAAMLLDPHRALRAR